MRIDIMLEDATWNRAVRAIRQAVAGIVYLLAVTGTVQGEGPGNNLPALSDTIPINSKFSLVHLGSIDSFDITEAGIKAAGLLLECLENPNGDESKAAEAERKAREAIRIYERVIPSENFGGEYTALKWFCEYQVADPEEKQRLLQDRFVASFFDFFANDDYANLKEYLKRKYHLAEIGDEDTITGHQREGFLEDFILFNNPRREQWEQTGKLLEVLNLKPGNRVADVGCGPGFFTVQFADLVGPQGHVHAIDINKLHLEYLTGLVKNLDIKNVDIVESSANGIGLSPDEPKVDCVFMCSLYHIIYTLFGEPQKDSFINSIRQALKPDGTFVVVDNAFLEDDTVPYHGPHMAWQLIALQLKNYGFRLQAVHQFIPQRYILVFKPSAVPDTRDAPPFVSVPGGVRITSRASLVHLPVVDAPDVTDGGTAAAKLLLTALETQDANAVRAARQAYRLLIPREKFGGEYTAFLWFCDYLLTPPANRQEMLTTPRVQDYFQKLGDNDFAALKKYVITRYNLAGDEESDSPGTGETGAAGQDTSQNDDDAGLLTTVSDITFWRDFVLFNNPNREQWEQTDRVIGMLDLKPGDAVADVGCGPGFYTFKFSQAVGAEGTVYAVDTNEDHLKYIESVAGRYPRNVRPVLSRLNDTKLPDDSVDVVFICSLYNLIYATSMEEVKDDLIASIRRALRKGGRFVVVDNGVVKPPDIPYHGPYIAPSLVIGQLKHYGFRLIAQEQVVPQRYVLVFEME